MPVYIFIRANGGWENVDLVLIEKHKCEDQLYALKKEREYIESLNATLNKTIPTRTIKEWRNDNQESIKEWKRGKTMCKCGKEYTQSNKARHERGKYHQENK